MTTPRVWLTAVTTTVLVLLGACDGADPSTQSSPGPTPSSRLTTSPEQSSTTTNPAAIAPRVENPLNADSFAEAPCTSITTAQRQALGLGAGSEGNPNGPVGSTTNCTYSDLDPKTGLIVSLDYFPGIDNGLSYRYEHHARYRWPIWEPTEIDGYPAVTWKNAQDPTFCELAVGVNDELSFNVRPFFWQWEGYTNQDTCALARDVATAVVSTIKTAN